MQNTLAILLIWHVYLDDEGDDDEACAVWHGIPRPLIKEYISFMCVVSPCFQSYVSSIIMWNILG